jgi:hypothetical protein
MSDGPTEAARYHTCATCATCAAWIDVTDGWGFCMDGPTLIYVSVTIKEDGDPVICETCWQIVSETVPCVRFMPPPDDGCGDWRGR